MVVTRGWEGMENWGITISVLQEKKFLWIDGGDDCTKMNVFNVTELNLKMVKVVKHM